MLRKVLRICAGAGCFFLGSLCLLFFLAAAHDLIVGDSETKADVLGGLFVFFGLLSLGSFIGTFFSFRPFLVGEKRSSAEHEYRILSFAKASGGRVTLADAALNCRLSLDTTRELLDSMSTRGINQVEFVDGTVVYVFTDFVQMMNPVEPPKHAYLPRQME